MELRKLTIDSQDLGALEEINEEAIPDCERNSFTDLMNTGATILGIYEDPSSCVLRLSQICPRFPQSFITFA